MLSDWRLGPWCSCFNRNAVPACLCDLQFPRSHWKKKTDDIYFFHLFHVASVSLPSFQHGVQSERRLLSSFAFCSFVLSLQNPAWL